MNQQIAVGVDGSTPSRAAIHWAVNRASSTGEQVLLLCVLDPDRPFPGPYDPDERGLTRLLEHESAYARSLAVGVQILTGVLHGSAMWGLVKATIDLDLIIIGTHKTGFAHGGLFGSRGLQLVAAARCPVVVVPEGSNQQSNGLIVGADQSRTGHAAVRFAAAEAFQNDQDLVLIRAWEPGQPTMLVRHRASRTARLRSESTVVLAELTAVAQSVHQQLRVRVRAIERVPAHALVDASAMGGLLVIGSSRPADAERGVLGTTCHDVLLNIKAPTVIVHSEDGADRSSCTQAAHVMLDTLAAPDPGHLTTEPE